MGFLKAKSDFMFALAFREDVANLWRFENKAANRMDLRHSWMLPGELRTAIQHEASQQAEYQVAREKVARGVIRAMRLANTYAIPVLYKSFPAPAVGGPIIPVNLFQSVLVDTSHGGVERQWVMDALNQLVGSTEDRLRTERRRLVNPVYWVREVLIFIVRIPFVIVEASGFNVARVEDHFLAKLFKLVEVVILIWLAARLGLGAETIEQVIRRLFGA